MRYLKLFENFESKKKFSVSFDDKFYQDVVNGLNKSNIKFEGNENLYFKLKKQTELFAWAKSEVDIIRSVPAWVRNLQVFRQK